MCVCAMGRQEGFLRKQTARGFCLSGKPDECIFEGWVSEGNDTI